MKQIRTVKLQLKVDSKMFKPTLEAYTNAFNYVCQTAWRRIAKLYMWMHDIPANAVANADIYTKAIAKNKVGSNVRNVVSN